MKAVKIPEVLSYRSRCKGEYWIEQVGFLLILALCLISTFFIFLGIVFVFWIKKIRRQRFALTPLLVLRRFGLDSLDVIGRFVQVYAFYVGEVRTVIEPGVKVMQVRGKPVSGIEFVRLPEHSWKQGVQREMQGAVAIIIDLSEPTEAVQWELNCALNKWTRKTVLTGISGGHWTELPPKISALVIPYPRSEDDKVDEFRSRLGQQVELAFAKANED